jgi:hypothetical protein
MLEVCCSDEGYDYGGGIFVEAAFFGDEPAAFRCQLQGGVCGFDFGFDV